jgi:hypothetical protein
VSSFDRFSLTIARWLTNVYDVDTTAKNYTTPGDVTRPALNNNGFAAQGSLGNSPSLFRSCTFERVRFKTLGGFNLGQAWFDDCRFVDCLWEGHFALSASLVNCTFTGRMNGCAWSAEQINDAGRLPNRPAELARRVPTASLAVVKLPADPPGHGHVFPRNASVRQSL